MTVPPNTGADSQVAVLGGLGEEDSLINFYTEISKKKSDRVPKELIRWFNVQSTYFHLKTLPREEPSG